MSRGRRGEESLGCAHRCRWPSTAMAARTVLCATRSFAGCCPTAPRLLPKEGVAGSSPAEGFLFPPAIAALLPRQDAEDVASSLRSLSERRAVPTRIADGSLERDCAERSYSSE